MLALRYTLVLGNRIFEAELLNFICLYILLQQVTAGVIKSIASKYIYDQCPAVAAVGG